VTIKNGRIQSFATGIDLSRTFSSTVTGLNLGGDYNGVVLTDSKVSVSGNLIGGNPADSNRGITVISGEGNAVQNNTVKGFQSVGILVGGSSTTVSRNTVSSTVDGDGIVMAAPQAKVTGNTVVASGYDGVFVEPGASGSVTGNTLSNNGDDGMYVHANSGSVVVANNVADYNQEWGIEGSPGVTDGGGNRATGNRNSPPCTYVHCS
jgi:parallel beta-helix repeat protein